MTQPGHPAGRRWARWVSDLALAVAEVLFGWLPYDVFASLTARACPRRGVNSAPPGAVMALPPEGQILLTVAVLP